MPPGGYGMPPGGYGTPPGAAPSGGGNGPKIAIIAAVALLLIGGVGVGVWLLTDSEPELARGELFLEPVADPGPDAFMSSVAAQPLASVTPLPVEHPPPPATGDTAAAEQDTDGDDAGVTQVTGVEATRPGLYGGTRDNSSCDVERMINFLETNTAQAQAFADVQGIDPQTLPTYLRGLTPVVLRADTLVINHGFSDGRATPRQSVLQTGTAVLVDGFGIPRVRCGCGNPLLPPQAPTANPTLTGSTWTGFDVNQIITVVNTTNINIDKFVIIDLNTNEPFEREPGLPPDGPDDTTITDFDLFCQEFPRLCEEFPGLIIVEDGDVIDDEDLFVPEDVIIGSGDVQVTLIWNGSGEDLDLHVIDPAGEEIAYFSSSSTSGGELDRDVIPGCAEAGPHVENVFWPQGGAPSGQYEAWVDVFSSCDTPSTFRLEVSVGGQIVDTITGSTGGIEESERIFFEVS